MLHAFKKLSILALGLLLTLAPAVTALAQQLKPVAVFSIASYEKIKADVGYLSELVGRKQDAEGAFTIVPIYLNGVDLKRPSGGYLTMSEAGEPKFVAFIPVIKLESVLATLEQFGQKATDAGDGLKQIDAPNGDAIYIKEAAGWAFVSNDKDSLASAPKDPTTLLGTLPATYNIAVRANVNDIPKELRQTAIDAIQSGLDRGLEENPAAGGDRELAEKLSRMSAKQFQRMIDELKEVTIGWGVDKQIKATYVDVTITAVDGTALSRQMALLKDSTSNFAGFLGAGSSVNLNGSTKMSPEDIEQNVTLLQLFQDRASKEIDNDAGLDANQRTSAKELIGQFFGALVDTVKAGKIDYGAALVLEEKKISFAGGLLVADGKKLETAFAKLIELAKNEPDFPDVKLNAGKHGAVNLHTIAVDIPEDEAEARDLFGEKLNVVVGTAPKAMYVAFGKDGEALMKKAIDASVATATKSVPPSQMNVYLKPIMKFAASMDKSGNPILTSVADAFQNATAGSDEINLFTKPIAGGVQGRLQVNEGVLKLIGDAVKANSPQ